VQGLAVNCAVYIIGLNYNLIKEFHFARSLLEKVIFFWFELGFLTI